MKYPLRLTLNALLLLGLLSPANAYVAADVSTEMSALPADVVPQSRQIPILDDVEEDPQVSDPPPSEMGTTSLETAIQEGAYPAQLVGTIGSVQPDVHGPQRTDPAQGIPDHAYSPFDELGNREHPCPPGGCDAMAGQVLVKFAPEVTVDQPARAGAWTRSTALNK